VAHRLGIDPLGELHRLAATADLETTHLIFSRLDFVSSPGSFRP
jgi:hypothetical protein